MSISLCSFLYEPNSTIILKSASPWYLNNSEACAQIRTGCLLVLSNSTLYLFSDSETLDPGSITEEMIARIVSIIGMAGRYKVFRIKPPGKG